MSYDDHHPAPQDPCTNRLCTQYRLQHRNMTQKRNELEKELEAMRKKHDALYNQVVTRGEASMMREAATGEDGVRLPNGEVMTAEKYMAKTRMMNQCRESLQLSEKKAKALAEENARLKQERDSLYASMRRYENMLHGFEKTRHFEVFSDEKHRETLEQNASLVEYCEQLRRNEREMNEEIAALRRRMQMYKKKDMIANINREQSPSSSSTPIPRKKPRTLRDELADDE